MPTTLTTPELADGEIYIGAIVTDAGYRHHAILLPGDHDDINWQGGMEWAASIGGDLPNRVEQALLFALFRNQFQEDAYWSTQQHESGASSAWYQDFNYGDQNYDRKLTTCRCRAVRRVAI